MMMMAAVGFIDGNSWVPESSVHYDAPRHTLVQDVCKVPRRCHQAEYEWGVLQALQPRACANAHTKRSHQAWGLCAGGGVSSKSEFQL
jgi:hypothetical protein